MTFFTLIFILNILLKNGCGQDENAFDMRETEAKLLIDFYIPLFADEEEEQQQKVAPSPVIKSEDDILAKFQIEEKSPEIVQVLEPSPSPVIKTEEEILAKFEAYFQPDSSPIKSLEQKKEDPSPVIHAEDDILSEFQTPSPQYSPKIRLSTEDEILSKFQSRNEKEPKENVSQSQGNSRIQSPIEESSEKFLEEEIKVDSKKIKRDDTSPAKTKSDVKKDNMEKIDEKEAELDSSYKYIDYTYDPIETEVAGGGSSSALQNMYASSPTLGKEVNGQGCVSLSAMFFVISILCVLWLNLLV
eukprot:TRINITY_DN648_c0_g1_i1.p2 TRINITY_DN648_c0_g1~~TRINITY_DN648_c0_g1_i1.p2  ORF type:complete len:301 (+),score=54.16 TRINITY_DN648_c0_g1_i1:252-1154(+)